jgi:methionyl-tRNA synthetase
MRLGINSEYKLPDYIPTRGHLTLEAKKISKSRNWYIGLKQFLEYYPADYLRYYLVSINPYSQDDLNFDWNDFTTRINSELIGNLGNFVNRALGFTKKAFDGKIPETESFDEKDLSAEEKIKTFATDVGSLMEQNHLDRALKKVMEFSSFFNQYFQHKEPWKNGPGTTNCVYLSVNAVRSLAIVLFPFLPESAQKIWNQLGLDGNVNEFSWNDISVLDISSGHTLGDASPLFVKVEKSDIAKYKKQLGPSE